MYICEFLRVCLAGPQTSVYAKVLLLYIDGAGGEMWGEKHFRQRLTLKQSLFTDAYVLNPFI